MFRLLSSSVNHPGSRLYKLGYPSKASLRQVRTVDIQCMKYLSLRLYFHHPGRSLQVVKLVTTFTRGQADIRDFQQCNALMIQHDLPESYEKENTGRQHSDVQLVIKQCGWTMIVRWESPRRPESRRSLVLVCVIGAGVRG